MSGETKPAAESWTGSTPSVDGAEQGDDAADDEVSPLELFFDLVFVFAVSQLSHHLLTHLTWRGAAETATLLVAVFGVWSYTSWGSTLPGLKQQAHRWMILTVMVVGLFMNAGLINAFEQQPWLFVTPYLACRIGPVVQWRLTGEHLRSHYSATLIWFSATAVLWIAGAASDPQARLLWWGPAALAELVGTWLAHPIPGRRFRTQHVAFDPGHMLERSRLFLLIALGEAILTTGTAIAEQPVTAAMVITASLAMVAVIALWALYFSGSDQIIAERAAATTDPLRAARLAVNTQILVLASLICLAVANETAIGDPTGTSGAALALLLFGGPVLYLAVQGLYLRLVTAHRPVVHSFGAAGLLVLLVIGTFVPALVATALLAAALVALVAATRNLRQRATPHHQAP